MKNAEEKDVKVLPKNHFNQWLKSINDHEIYLPVGREGYSEYAKFNSKTEFDIGVRNTVIPPKGLIFDQTLSMLKFNLSNQPAEVEMGPEVTDDSKKRVIIGIRPCDAAGISALDPTFDAEFKDQYYLAMRKSTVLVGFACNNPDINCFCSSVNSGPFDGKNLDIMLIDIGQEFIFNVYSKEGEELIKPFQSQFVTPTKNQIEEAELRQSKAESKPTRRVNTDHKQEKMDKLFEADYWEDVAKKCLGCGICTYVCPTCYCFDITDEKWGSKGERIRSWDSCMYPEYTVHASGYNPRPARWNRLRNRFYHKFKYYPDLHNIFGCTGCGRCVRQCPVNIDIIDVINGIDDLKVDGGS